MRKTLITSIALLAVGALAIAGIALLGPDGALAQDSDEPNVEYHFEPLDQVLDELVDEEVIDIDQANAVRDRMSERAPLSKDGFPFHMDGIPHNLPEGLTPPPGPPGTDEFEAWVDEMHELMGDEFDGHMFRFDGELPEDGAFPFHGRDHDGPGFMGDGFGQFFGELPEGLTPPPGPPGTDEFDQWLDEMQELLGDDFFDGHTFGFDGQPPGGAFFGGEGFPQFHGLDDFTAEDLQSLIDEMTQRYGGEFPDPMQDMLDHLQEELSNTEGAEIGLGA